MGDVMPSSVGLLSQMVPNPPDMLYDRYREPSMLPDNGRHQEKPRNFRNFNMSDFQSWNSEEDDDYSLNEDLELNIKTVSTIISC